MTISRILVPTDFSANAGHALEYALELAHTFGASVHLVHVIEDPAVAGVWSSEVYTAEIAGLQVNLLRDAERRLQRSVPENAGTVSTEVRTGNAARQILDAAREQQVDLIVMGTRGRTGLAHLLMGSVAERVVRMAKCPVLTIHSNGKGVATPRAERDRQPAETGSQGRRVGAALRAQSRPATGGSRH